jgi:hypothetical protein
MLIKLAKHEDYDVSPTTPTRFIKGASTQAPQKPLFCEARFEASKASFRDSRAERYRGLARRPGPGPILAISPFHKVLDLAAYSGPAFSQTEGAAYAEGSDYLRREFPDFLADKM